MAILQPAHPSTAATHNSPAHRIRLVRAGGTVLDFPDTISAGDALQSSLRLQHQHSNLLADMPNSLFNNFLICDSASLRIGKRACPMHPNTTLEVGHLYYVLPIRTFQHRLSWSHISSLAAMATSVASSSSSAAATHKLTYHKSSPSSERQPVGRTFARIPNAKFFLQLLLCHRLRFRGRRGRRVNDMDAATLRAGASSGLPLDTDQPWRVAGVLSSKCSREASRRFNNICDNAEMNAKYVEQLIDRSNSWRPPLFTIQECLAV